jgi:hypothetical protein
MTQCQHDGVAVPYSHVSNLKLLFLLYFIIIMYLLDTFANLFTRIKPRIIIFIVFYHYNAESVGYFCELFNAGHVPR